MRIVVNHLTRMQPGYICVAGIDVQDNEHIRPVLGRARLTVDLLARNGGAFDVVALSNWGVGARKQVFVAALAIVTAEGA